MKPFPEQWKGTRVGVLGLARSGIALAKVLTKLGAHVLVSDTRKPEQLPVEEAVRAGAEVETGGHSVKLLQTDLIVISPGVSVHADIVQKALQAGVPVTGEVEIAWRLCPKPLIAVTGTNGKSTTSSLIDRSLAPRSLLAGNIGVPLVAEVSGELGGVDWVVAEISSFQLETVHQFRPRISVLTNITPDHLDRHRTMEEYMAAKCRLFWRQTEQDYAVFNQDDELAAKAADLLSEGKLPAWLPGFPPLEQKPNPIVWRYSVQGPVPQGVWYQDGFVKENGNTLFRWDFRGLPGPHNLSNGLAACAAARLAGARPEQIEKAFREYGNLHHRLELVGTHNGIRFIDDSKATNVSSVEAALDTYHEPIVLIAGGRDKGLDLEGLGAIIARKAHGLVAIGEAGPTIAEAASRHGLKNVQRATSMDDAVQRAFRMAPAGGVVLLSPACTSFDMFLHAEDRGDKFAESVRRLTVEVK